MSLLPHSPNCYALNRSNAPSTLLFPITRHALFCLTATLLLSACGGSDASDNSSNDSSNTPELPSQPTPPTPPDNPDSPNNPETDINWLPAGGNATIAADISRPFLQIMPNLPSSDLGGVSPGRELFITEWTPANQGRVLFDGVGPLFNANACTQCHSAIVLKDANPFMRQMAS